MCDSNLDHTVIERILNCASCFNLLWHIHRLLHVPWPLLCNPAIQLLEMPLERHPSTLWCVDKLRTCTRTVAGAHAQYNIMPYANAKMHTLSLILTKEFARQLTGWRRNHWTTIHWISICRDTRRGTPHRTCHLITSYDRYKHRIT